MATQKIILKTDTSESTAHDINLLLYCRQTQGAITNNHYIWALRQQETNASQNINSDDKIEVLKSAVIGYKNTLDYNGLYISYLLDQISEDEFINQSKKFVVQLSNDISDEIIGKIRLLFELTNEQFTPSEISNLFSIEENLAESILVKLEENKLI